MIIDTTGTRYDNLYQSAVTILDSVQSRFGLEVPWRWGGGTAMMLRHNHRFSFDIDIFVDDPQYLGYLTPRLNDSADDITSMYDEQNNFLKLYLPEGEIDFIVGPPLMQNPVMEAVVNGRKVLLETDLEIVAKKIFYRSQTFTGRDVFDLHFLITNMSNVVYELFKFSDKFVDIENQLNKAVTKAEFEMVRSIEFHPSFDDAVISIKQFTRDMVGVVLEGTFNGMVLNVIDGVATQKVGRDPDRVVRHNVARLSEKIVPGDVLDINYRGGVGVVGSRTKEIEI